MTQLVVLIVVFLSSLCLFACACTSLLLTRALRLMDQGSDFALGDSDALPELPRLGVIQPSRTCRR
jgi:hypothetical protein